jgi:RNA polymerase sigma factor (sigma-70 family)
VNSPTDQQLLRDYAECRSEVAFAEIVRRYVDLVYSAALRMVRDAHLAEDVTQGAFVALAKSAHQLTDRPVLSGWLHRTAQNLAANAVRTEVRRRAREQEAAAMNELLTAESEISWDTIAPYLDAALGELSEPDRDALLLRYFERKSAREMADILGISNEAAQKRVSRAVERLREFFSKRNVTVGASGLIVLISANAVQSAPVGLAATISTAAVLAGTTVSTSTAITTTKVIAMTTLQKTLVTATVAVLAGAGIFEARQASQFREQVRTLQQQQAPLTEQIRQLQHERDDATNRLTALIAENEQLKASQKAAELLKLRGEVGALRQSLANMAATNRPSAGLSALMRDPAMKEYIHQKQLKAIKERYAPLVQQLNLTPEDTEKFTQLVGDALLKGTDLASSLTQGDGDRVQTLKAMADTRTEMQNQLQALLGEAGYAQYTQFNQAIPAQTTVKLLNQQLGDNGLSDDQSAHLAQIVAAEPYAATHGIDGELDPAFFSSQEDIDAYLQQVVASNQRILDQASSFLTSQQLAALEIVQSNSINAQITKAAALAQKH